MKLPPVYAILNLDDVVQPLEYLSKLLAAGVRIVQLRAKKLSGSDLAQLTQSLIELAREIAPAAKIIINDSPELALVSGADGVHLGQDDTSASVARSVLGKDRIIGLSTHNIEQVRNSEREPIDYIGFGPVFKSPTKQGHAPETGLQMLKDVVSISTKPVVAIGGIDQLNAKSVYAAGANSIAMISALANCANPKDFIEQCIDNASY